jgi:membrane protein
MIFKYLPDIEIQWNDVWIGAAVTAFLFTIGKVLIGLFIGKTSVASIYGVAGSLVILLIWIYYSAQIFFFGAEFTQAYANQFGSRLLWYRHSADNFPGTDSRTQGKASGAGGSRN